MLAEGDRVFVTGQDGNAIAFEMGLADVLGAAGAGEA